MGFWELARGTKDLERISKIHEGVVMAQAAKDRGEPVPMTEVTVRWRRMSMSWDEAPVIIPTDLLPVACALSASYQDAKQYPVLHVDANSGNPENGRYVTFKNDEIIVIELHTRPHVPESNQDEQRRAKLRGSASHRIRTPEGMITRVYDDQKPETD